ncbi:MAG: hypothetical protein AAF773_14525 [Cyanobacteria bacterium P01_D01_bin.115]
MKQLFSPRKLGTVLVALSLALPPLSASISEEFSHKQHSMPPLNVRQLLLDSAKENDPDLSLENSSVAITHFSYVCELMTDSGDLIYVADRRAVLLGMAAPRGLNYITFFKEDHSYLGKIRYVHARPLRCNRGELYLYTNIDSGGVSSQDNVIDVSEGFENLRFISREPFEDLYEELR